MTCADHSSASTHRIERHAHRGHERARAEDAAEIIVHRAHDRGWTTMLAAAVMKEQLGQSGEQRRRCAMSGSVDDPKERAFISHAQPAIDVAAHLNDRPIESRYIPAVE